MLDAHRIRVFRSVMASGSIQAAAENLGYTPSAISQQIASLQKETGLTLFERRGRGLAATAAARALVAQTDELMGQLRRLDTVISDLREGRPRRLRIGYFASAGAEWMPRLAQRLNEEMPDITLELLLNELPGGVRTPPDLDIVVDAPGSATPAGTRKVPLMDDPYVAILRDDHRFAEAPEVALAELAGETWVRNDLRNNACSRILAAACEAAGFQPRFAVEAQDHYTAIAFVKAGAGITVVPGLASHVLPTTVRAVPLTAPKPVRHIAAVIRDGVGNRAAERAVELLLDLIT